MRRHLPLFALAAWAAVIFTVSSIPNPPDAGGGDWRYNVAHVVEYLIFGALTVLAIRSYWPGSSRFAVALAAWTLSVAYGMSDEFHQSFVPNRDASWQDVGLDSFGAFLGILVSTLASSSPRRPRQ